jgi:hypothetical protein
MSRTPPDLKITLSTRLFITTLMSVLSLGFGYALIEGFWETTSLECGSQAATKQIGCHIHQETYPGRSIDINIAKAQLSRVQISHSERTRRSRNGSSYRVVLLTKTGAEIPLTRSFGTNANEQLVGSIGEINRFIDDPQPNTLSIQTSRSWLLWPLAGFVLLADYIFLSVVWKPTNR